MGWKQLPNDTGIGPRSRVKFIAALFSLTRGTFGLTLKPKLMQIMFKPEENHFDTCNCLFEETDDEETEKLICLNSSPIGLSRRLSDNPDLGYDESD